MAYKGMRALTIQAPNLVDGTGDWREEANCIGTDMHPDADDKKLTAAALEACAGCPVKAECLEFVLSYPPSDQHGVWGGLTSRQRVQLIRRGKQDGQVSA